ncbi:TSL-kinase interacting protein 1 [Actinidia eriantha]|uniref:TSL-kinase interacting protein 1 n=1 Tax=Actinidia eriantha TaxID=165200 RepID=UPI00258F8361|nr:TSL-kinase interacting protein 1 [Actinidia eriantha]
MKTTKQREGKIVEVPKKQNAIVCCTGVKKSEKRIGGWHPRRAVSKNPFDAEDDPGILPLSAGQMGGQQSLRKFTLSQETTKEVLKLEPKIGLHPSEKIKLQLFPIDEGTRIGLENDGHNPFLELTLRAWKKISSVLKHLNSKWEYSTVALGDPMLFPYNIQLEKLSSYKRWTLNDKGVSAGDVHAAIQSPTVFRLRYGWFPNLEPKTIAVPSTSTHLGTCFESEGLQKDWSKISELMDDRKEKRQITSEDFKTINPNKKANAVVTKNMSVDAPVDCLDDEVKVGNGLAQTVVPWDNSLTNLGIGGLLSDASLQGKISCCNPKSEGSKLNSRPIQLISSEISIGGLLSEASLQGRINNHERKSNEGKLGLQLTMDQGLLQSSVPWSDSLTNLSIGGLLSEASLLGKIDCYDPKSNGSKLGLQPTPLISDSLDAFIAGQLDSQPQESKPWSHVSRSSILDAEETCHAFPFRKFSSSGKDVRVIGNATPWDSNHDGSSKSFKFSNFSKLNGQGEFAQDPPCQESNTGLLTHFGVNNDESSLGLAGIKWTESLGSFDVGLPTSRQITSADSVNLSEFVR